MSERILVADDEADIRELVSFALRRRGYVILDAAAGDTALDLIRAEQPDLVVLDVGMPGLNGLEVVTAMKADPACASIPIIILSAKGQVVEVEQGLSVGAQRYLVKPFAPKELAAMVSEVLAQSRGIGEDAGHVNQRHESSSI